MNDNLPEINISKKPEKKRGALGWLRGLGTGSRGAIGAMGGSSSSGFAGLAGLLAGNISTVVTIALVATAGGVYLAHNSSAPMINSGSFSSNKGAESNYVPGILRSEKANQGSSLAMFTDTNKGSGLSLEENASAKASANAGGKTGDQAAAASAKDEPKGDESKTPDAGAMVQGLLGGQGGGAGSGSLTSSIGGSSSGKFAMMGKPQNGPGGSNGGLSGGVGSGFQAMPKFNERKGKLMAMSGVARPVTSNSKAAKQSGVGKGAWNQSKALSKMQNSYGTGNKADTLRYTQDAAWTGNSAGDSTEGAGLGDGNAGAGIVTSPSLDNASDGGSAGSNGSNGISIPECTGSDEDCAKHEEQPWEKLASWAMYLIYASAALSIAGAACINAGNTPYTAWLKIVGYVLCALAALAAVAALVLSIIIMKDNALIGTVYALGAAVATAAAGVACFGDPSKGAMTNVLWMGAAAGILSMLGSMAKT